MIDFLSKEGKNTMAQLQVAYQPSPIPMSIPHAHWCVDDHVSWIRSMEKASI